MALQASAHELAPIALGDSRWPRRAQCRGQLQKVELVLYSQKTYKDVPFFLILPQLNPLIQHNPIQNPKGIFGGILHNEPKFPK